MLKETLERKLMTLPLNKHQHAFRNGRSCDTALSEVVINNIEKVVLRGQYALGVFLDISGAFDNLDPVAAAKGLRKINLYKYIVEWYKW